MLHNTDSKEIDSFMSLSEFDGHRAVYRLFDDETGLKAFVGIHRKNGDIPSFGATRMRHYGSEGDAARDALRLSRLMSYKAVMAGLPCGGAKGVIMEPGGRFDRKKIIEKYAEKISDLNGEFVTGTDVGLSQDDLKIMASKTKNVVGFRGDPAYFTAAGIYQAIRRSLKFVFGQEDLTEKTFAVQGLGKVGFGLVKFIFEDGGVVYASDVDESKINVAKNLYPALKIVDVEEIHKITVDVFSPCALNYSINKKTVNELKCRMVVGGANNQLESLGLGDELFNKGILYAPDYVVNAGGLISVYDEYEHEDYDSDRVAMKVSGIGDTLEGVFLRSKRENLSPARIADKMAEETFNGY